MPASKELRVKLAATIEACRAPWSADTVLTVLDDLSAFPEAAVIEALARCRRELKHPLSVADIIERIEEGLEGPVVPPCHLPDSTSDGYQRARAREAQIDQETPEQRTEKLRRVSEDLKNLGCEGGQEP